MPRRPQYFHPPLSNTLVHSPTQKPASRVNMSEAPRCHCLDALSQALTISSGRARRGVFHFLCRWGLASAGSKSRATSPRPADSLQVFRDVSTSICKDTQTTLLGLTTHEAGPHGRTWMWREPADRVIPRERKHNGCGETANRRLWSSLTDCCFFHCCFFQCTLQGDVIPPSHLPFAGGGRASPAEPGVTCIRA